MLAIDLDDNMSYIIYLILLTNMKEAQRCKILLLGESAVGKTSLFKKYVGQPNEKPTPTIGVEYKQKIIQVGSKILKVQLWDTAGTERFRTITPIYYRNVDGVLLVFDLTDRNSFISIQYWINQLREKGEDGAQLLLVGNKNDLQEDREVTRDEAEAMARQLDISYIEANSLNYASTSPPFDKVISLIISKRNHQGVKVTKGNTNANGVITLREPPQKRDKTQNQCC